MSDEKQIGYVRRAWREGDYVYAAIDLAGGAQISAIIATRRGDTITYLTDEALDQIAADATESPIVDRAAFKRPRSTGPSGTIGMHLVPSWRIRPANSEEEREPERQANPAANPAAGEKQNPAF